MGIAAKLMLGRISFDKQAMHIVVSDAQSPINHITYSEMKHDDWGQVYEKFVGQHFEDEGYQVQYNGLTKGFFDQGIDIIASKEDEIIFIQCKYTKQFISKSRIDWILYKASPKLLKSCQNESRRIVFMLVVKSIDINFSRRMPKGMQFGFSSAAEVKYPILKYFLDHNHTQDKVKLICREIPMDC